MFRPFLLWISLLVLQTVALKVQHKVKCSEEFMQIELRKPDDATDVYLEGLKYYPDKSCKPHMIGPQIIFKLSLKDVFQCGVTRVFNQATGLSTYYHRIIMESGDKEDSKTIVSAKCFQVSNHTVYKRNVLPAGFQEPIDLDITSSLTEVAPQPKLQVGVRQAGKLVSGELNVNPGTPLQMEIFLDKDSAPVYGLLVSYMQVSDTKAQEETIIFNGCSVDPYLFENFNTVDGDFLTAKFRAFKFPDSTYVQFKGTVNVCLDKCRGVECSNGQLGYGRKRRDIPTMPPDPNKVFEVSITSFIKVDYKGENILDKAKLDFGQMTPDNGTMVRELPDNDDRQQLKLAGAEIREMYTVIEERSQATSLLSSALFIGMAFVFLALH